MALVTRVAMGTLNNRRFINMATVPVGTAKTFRKFIRSVLQVCNIAMEKKNSLELVTLDLLSISISVGNFYSVAK